MAPILVLEGGAVLTDNPADAGGVTIFGITEATAREAGYTGAMAAMTEPYALTIYRNKYWARPGFDKIDPILPPLAEYMLQTGINLGPSVPSAFLQRALNVLSNQGTLYPMLTVDGHCGGLTRSALCAYRTARPVSEDGDLVLMGLMRALTVVSYVSIAEADPSLAVFTYGWLRNRALGLPS